MRIALIPSVLRLPDWLRLPAWLRGRTVSTPDQARPAVPPFAAVAVARVWRTLRTTGNQLATYWEVVQENKIPRFLLILLVFTVVLGVWLYNIEQGASEEAQITSMENGLWWAIVTMTTTGYGDLVPKTTAGRLAASFAMLAGMTVTSLLTASFASALVARRLSEARGLEALDLHDHTVVCGWNERAEEVIAGLITTVPGGRPTLVLVNELPEERLAELRYKYRRAGLRFVRGDQTHEEVLDRAGVALAASVIVLADSVGAPGGEDSRTIVTVLTVEKMNPDVKTTAELLDPDNEPDVRRAGVDELVLAGQDAGFFLAGGAIAPGLGAAARELLRAGGEAEIRRVEFPRDLRGHTYADAFAWYRQQGMLLAGVISEAAAVTLDDLLGHGTGWVDEFIRRMLAETSQEVLGQDQEKIKVLFGPDDGYVIGATDAALIIGGTVTVS